MKSLRADIAAIGSELLHGGRVDSNSLFISHMLAQCGIRMRQKLVIGDNVSDIQKALKASLRQVDVVVLTGGLGSTVDDCTREAVANACQRPLKVRRQAKQILIRQLQKRNRAVTPLLAKQAYIPSGATVLDNPVGTAPGFVVQQGQCLVIVLPGVPREAREMMDSQVRSILKRKLRSTAVLWSHSFNTTGLPETDIQQQLMPLWNQSSAIDLSLLPSTKGVQVTLSSWVPQHSKASIAKATPKFPEGEALIQEVRKALEPWVFSEGDDTMEEMVGQLLTQHKLTVALAESCTGGLIAHRLTEVPGSSQYLDRSLITYSNHAKQQLLGVSSALLRKYGAVSVQVAEAMACGIRVNSHVDLGVSVTGIAGPGGGSTKKPVGLVYMAIDGPHGRQSQRFQFGGNRTEIKFRTSQAALNMIRRYLLHGSEE